MLTARIDVRLGAFRLDVDVSVAAGRVTAVLGPNGAGKTTLLRCIQGAQAIDAGRIAVGERVLDEVPGTFLAPRRRRLGIVHQDYLLFGHLSAVDNVAFGLRAAGMARTDADERARAWLHRVGLADVAAGSRVRASTLSGGQAQRVALVRALAVSPEALLLDEPLAALDAGARPTVRRDLAVFLGDFEGPTLLVTHDPVDAITLADDVVVLEAGRVVRHGRVDDVVADPGSDYVAELFALNRPTH